MSTNISKKKRDDLVRKIKKIRTYIAQAEQNENTGNLLSYLSDLEKEVQSKKYGVVFEEHRESIDEVLETHIPVLSEEKDLLLDNGGQMNFLIEGDNLATLKLLQKTHRERIDLIYIDPPYNTGSNDFIYDDTFVDEEDSFRHSKWLSFMEKRIELSKKLLKKSGVIFISIGEQEVSSLKLLCDYIFGETNFITIFSRQMKSGGAKGKYYTPSIDYVLTYAKNILHLPHFRAIMTQNQIDVFYNKIEESGTHKGERYGEERLFKASLDARPNQRYYIQCPDGSFAIPPGVHFPSIVGEGEKVLPTKEDKVWKWIYPRYKEELKQGNIVFKKTKTSGLVDEAGKKSKWNIYNKLWLREQQEKGVVPSNFIQEFENRQSAAELKKIGIDFTYAKPMKLIKYLLTIANQENDCTVLDFFAGSGTTGHAVMELNAEDGGKRNYILSTDNQNNICHAVTYERCKRVIEKENYNASLKYYKIDYVPISEQLYYEYADELLLHIRELVELENGINLTNNAKISIVLTEVEVEDFIANIDAFNKCRKLYMGHDVLLSGEQEQLLKDHRIKVNIIPDYYYRELEE